MSNIIRLNETAPNDQWIVMSNQGTDCFLDLLIMAAENYEKTERQEELIVFLKDQKEINDTAPGTAGFDLDEMPWQVETLKDDAGFLLRVTAEAQSESVFAELPYEADRDIMIPRLEQFAGLLEQMKDEAGRAHGGTNMKEVILSADGDSVLYMVPAAVADNLEEYCLKFCSDWLRNSPDAERYRAGKAVCYTEADFIDYLNTCVFPDCKSKMIKNLGWTELGKNLPEEYKDHPYYNF